MYAITETIRNFYLRNNGSFGYGRKDARMFDTYEKAVTFASNIRTPTKVVLL